MTAGRSAAASSVITDFWAATRTSIIPNWFTTTTPWSRPRPRRKATISPKIWSNRAISFIADAKQVAPDKPFFLYFCPGATHAPHHVRKEWADRYKGQFDDGWDAYREKTFTKQKQLGIVPKDAELSRHDPDVQQWESLSAPTRRSCTPA